MADPEIDFPREDLSETRRRRKTQDSDDGEIPRTKKVRSVSNQPKSEFDGIWNRRMTPEFLTEGVLGLGVVKEIHETEVLLECADSLMVRVPVQNFGSALVETLRTSSLELEDIFKIGQMLAFKVVNPKSLEEIQKKPKKVPYPVVSCDPFVVNFHLNPGALSNGLVISGIVESVEDKGIIVNLGLQSVELKGFLPKNNLPSTFQSENLIVGQPLLLRIQHESLSNKKIRIINLSGVPEIECLDEAAVEKLKMNRLMPGTILSVNPIKPSPNGVYVDIGNDIKGYISRQHLPPRYRGDTTKCLKAFRAIVMFCQQNSNLLVLNGHPDIVAASKITKRTNFEGIHIGDIIECKVSSVDKHGNVNFDLVLSENSRNPLITAFANKTKLEDGVNYKVGMIHQARVLSYRMVERELIVATRKDILAQKMVSVKDAVPGERVTAKVESILPRGLFVRIYDSIPGLIPKIHLSDKLMTRIDKHFSIGDQLNCRILIVDSLKSRLILTNKPSLTTNKDVIIKSYADATPGMITTGYISYQHPSGGLIIGFYGGTRAFMFPREVERLGTIVKLGQTVRVRVISVDPQNERMLVAVADTSGNRTTTSRTQPFPVEENDPISYSAIVENISMNGSKLKQGEMLNVAVRLKKKLGGKIKASIPKELLSDCLDLPLVSLNESIASGSVLPKVTVLGDVAGNLKVTSKRFIIDWLEGNPRITGIENLTKGQLVCGTVIQKHPEMGYFVELAGGSALTAPARFIHPETMPPELQELQVGQTIVARVSSIDLERKRFALILDPELCVPSDTEPDYFAPHMAQCAMEELNWLAENNAKNMKIPKIGECIDVKIKEISKNGIVVKCSDGFQLTGFARTASPATVKKGTRAKALVLDIRLPSCDLDVFLLDDGIQHFDEKKLKALLKSTNEYDARIWIRKRDYAIATVEVEKSTAVVCIPTRTHPNLNTVSETLDESNSHWTITPKRIVGNVLIGTTKEALKRYASAQKKLKTSVKPAVKKKLKQFGIYPAKVLGMWSRAGVSHSSVELQLPGGNFGRLHASEFDESFLKRSQPVKSFLKEWKGKTLNVKIICFTKLKEQMEKKDLSKPKAKGKESGEKMTVVTRLAECTMKPSKLNETKKKQSLLSYPQTYIQGSFIPVFVCKGPHVGVVKVEVTPLWNGVIRKQNLRDENLISNPADEGSALIDIDFEPGEKLMAQVIGVNVSKKGRGKSRHRKCLELTLKDTRKTFSEDDCVTGRVVGITQSPSTVVFELTNDQRAVLTLTGITDDYQKALQAVKSYELNQIYNVQLLHFDSDMGRWFAVTEARSEASEDESKSALYRDMSDIEVSSVHQAFVTSSAGDAHVFAEISPGVGGRVDKCNIPLRSDDLITVRVTHVFPDGGLKLAFVDLIAKGPKEEKPRKRLVSTGSDTTADLPRKKSRSAGYMASDLKVEKPPQVKPIEVKLPEPGFDWSLEGFTPMEFAKVGQIGEKTDNVSGSVSQKEKSDADEVENKKKPKTKEQLQMDEEKRLVNRERKILAADWIPDNTTDFDRLVAGTPNSSALWIRYISFFLENNDIEKARAIAERALSVINFREEDEIFNVWTAYLNLEANFGTDESLKAIFDNAIKNTDALKMYKQMVKIYQSIGKIEETDDLLEDMLKRFRHDDLDVWFICGQHFLETKRGDKARDLMKKAINCLPQKHHVTILSRFAQLEFKFGDVEQSKTIFESILNSYPKKTDIWTVYIDLLIKAERIDEARQLLERVTALKLSTHKIRLFFKKWMDLEQKHGDEELQKVVKERAVQYLEGVTDTEA